MGSDGRFSGAAIGEAKGLREQRAAPPQRGPGARGRRDQEFSGQEGLGQLHAGSNSELHGHLSGAQLRCSAAGSEPGSSGVPGAGRQTNVRMHIRGRHCAGACKRFMRKAEGPSLARPRGLMDKASDSGSED